MTPTEERIRADVAELLDCTPEELTPDEDLFDRGLDSMRLMDLVERWRADGAATLEFADLVAEPELRAWTAIVGRDR